MGHYYSEMEFKGETLTCKKCKTKYTQNDLGSWHPREECLEARLQKLESVIKQLKLKVLTTKGSKK